MDVIQINYVAVLVCSVLAMVTGAIWYGPLFGKKWMEVIGVDAKDKSAREKMQKSAGRLYVIQFLLTLFQVYVFAFYVKGWNEVSGVTNAVWIWAAFIMPTLVAASMWTNENPKVQKARFFIQAGYQLVLFMMFGIILGAW